jgi:phosphoglycolate phosphatase
MTHYQNAIFDLDGTLTDSKPGILGCLIKALDLHRVPWTEPLDWFIGPPAEQSLQRLMPHADDPARLALLRDYRQCYDASGWQENSVYPGITQILAFLKEAGWKLFVCTAKREDFTLRVLDKFALATYFDAVYADQALSLSSSKVVLLRRLIAEQGLAPASSVMIGDRHFDIEAARVNEVTSVAVTYGYGSAEELEAARPDHTCNTVAELLPLLQAFRPVTPSR